jgi:excisionase family DNA binding protein
MDNHETTMLKTVTSQQAAALLGVTQTAIRKMVEDGRLAGVQPKFRAHYRISLAAVNEYAAEQRRLAVVRLERNAEMSRKLHNDPPAVKSQSPPILLKRLVQIEDKLDRLLSIWESD